MHRCIKLMYMHQCVNHMYTHRCINHVYTHQYMIALLLWNRKRFTNCCIQSVLYELIKELLPMYCLLRTIDLWTNLRHGSFHIKNNNISILNSMILFIIKWSLVLIYVHCTMSTTKTFFLNVISNWN